ncbi:class A beta-lactamase-related serine hydrolase [Nocardia arizonensis]|uniref:class A beta-lactamase-related serine hydrolase n=1 Tax=Nocardia arizonensis TaxID=1141647 RepID=UPI001EF3EAB8|nr:class A beta-lactamase-related serine hydrolase [Nocardia arizonensis]
MSHSVGRVALGVLALLLTASCGADAGESGSAAETTSITQAAAVSEPRLSLTLPGTLAAGFQELQGTLRGHYGMAIMPVGGTKMVTFGDWTTGPAWSTMKVPLTIAAIRGGASTGGDAATAAITESDNAAADVLWQALGSGQTAAAAVEAVLRDGGDAETVVPATRVRAEHSAFGQAQWSLAEQVRFASRLPCMVQSAPVIKLMEQIVPSHRWGLGAFSGAEFKGGWGPDTSGKYLVRQFGLISTPSGQIAIAFAAQPDSGAFSDGMNALDKMASLISEHLGELAAGKCSP